MLGGGTLTRENICQLIGKLTLNEVEEMVRRGFVSAERAEKTIKKFRENVEKGKRTV